MSHKVSRARTVAFVGVLGALSCVLMMFRFPVPFVPGFYEFDIAELPALFAGFYLGPVSGCAVVFCKNRVEADLPRDIDRFCRGF